MEKPLNIPPFIKPKPPEIPHKLGAVRRPAGALNQQRQSPDLGRLAPLQPSLSQNSAIIEASKHQAPLASQAGLPCLNQAISSATPATPAAVNWGSFFQSPQHTPSPERFADLRGIIDGISPKFGVRKPVGYIPITPSSFASTPIYKFSPPSCFLAPQQQQGLKGSSYTPSRSTAFSNYSPSRGDLTPQHQSSTCLLPHTPNEVSFIGNPQMSHKLSRFHVPLSSQVAGKASLNIPLRQESASSGKASLNIPLRQESASSSPALTGNRHDSPDDSTPLILAVLKPSSLSVSPPSPYAGPIKAPGIYKPGLCHQATAPIHDLSSNTPTTLIPAVRAPLLNWQACQPRLPRQSGLLSASSVLLPPASVGLPALRPAPPRPGRQVLEPLPTAPKTVIVQQLQQPDLPVDLPVKPFNQLHIRQQQRLQQQVHGFRPTEGVPHPVLQRASSAQKVVRLKSQPLPLRPFKGSTSNISQPSILDLLGGAKSGEDSLGGQGESQGWAKPAALSMNKSGTFLATLNGQQDEITDKGSLGSKHGFSFGGPKASSTHRKPSFEGSFSCLNRWRQRQNFAPGMDPHDQEGADALPPSRLLTAAEDGSADTACPQNLASISLRGLVQSPQLSIQSSPPAAAAAQNQPGGQSVERRLRWACPPAQPGGAIASTMSTSSSKRHVQQPHSVNDQNGGSSTSTLHQRTLSCQLPASRWNSHLPSQGSALKVRARASLVKGRTDLGSSEQKMTPTKALAAGEVGDAAMVPLSSAAMKLSLRAAHQRLEQGQAGDGVVDEAEHLLYSGRTSDIVEGHTVSKGEGVQTSALATITCSFLTCEFCETYSVVSSPVRMAGSASPAENSPAGVAAHVESPVGVAAHVESLGHLSVLRGGSKRTEHQSQSHLASADTDEQPKIYRRTESGNNRNHCSSIAGSKNDFMRSTARRSLGSTFEKNCGKF
ncbi:hypothetical protein CEUSTIGMA_g13652.t1 [Chlamydomonas eustigma]|uniref:Uncharacterized protein n=1 Tax=Chlamydomonas eustigma TaxID=1157962 RepID=A0A250XTF3_9CHLO|nr:hypothetical protein CEUSTIGMA_g13652.t1 [Chlamydomonas eustigma]|eukprot:GAX86239.1 hypothetical protein CEUSTIGMA_g13652.t1 [Chlamydomonas eustigma]